MPVHDWTRVGAGIFHHFHQDWVPTITRVLNDGRMPDGFYALTEQVVEGPKPDVIALEARTLDRGVVNPIDVDDRAVAVMDHPPKVRFTAQQEREAYANSASRVGVYHSSGDRLVAVIEIVSPGNKHTAFQLQKFIDKLNAALERGIHLLVVDIHPAGKHDPRGIHAVLWDMRTGESHGVTPAEPLGLAAYRCDDGAYAYFERIAAGDPLPDMPVFLTPRHYVNVPLERTYGESYEGVPTRWKSVIENRPC